MTDILSTKEGTKSQSVEKVTGGNKTSHRTKTKIGLKLKEGGYGRDLGYGVAVVVAVFLHEVHGFLECDGFVGRKHM